MDLILNELSFSHPAENGFKARELMIKLLLTCREAKKFEFNKLRVSESFSQYTLSENYTIFDWLNDSSVKPEHKTLFLGLRRYPFIAEGDEAVENQYIKNYYYLHAPNVPGMHEQETEGLAVAFLYNTLAISQQSHDLWNQTSINLIEKTPEAQQNVSVNHVACPEHFNFHREWLEANLTVNLVESTLSVQQKEINLRDDHGKDVLTKFAEKLVKSPYVDKIINSLPFNPKCRHFIKDIYPDGKIEIVLTKSDAGIGLILQSTGRNLQETKVIADILEKSN